MKFLKFTVEREDSTYHNYIPTELWNYTVVTHLIQKIKVEEGQEEQIVGKPAQALALESSSMMEKAETFPKNIKHSNDGKIINEVFETKIMKMPYQVIINNEEDVERFVKWLESNLVEV